MILMRIMEEEMLRDFLYEEDGIGTVEMILILVENQR